MYLKDIPIQRKLMSVILLTCTVVLILICSAYILFEYASFRNILKNNMSILGVVVSSNSSAALAFDSQNDANEILNALKGDEHIVAGCLFDKDGNLFAKYPLDISSGDLPSGPQKDGYYYQEGYLVGFEPIIQADERLGTLFIKSDLKALNAQLRYFILIAIFLFVGSLFVAYILSNLLQKSISQPIVELEQTAKIISASQDYSIRAVKAGEDEIGSLTDTFNGMLTQIEAQNLEIISSEEHSSKLAAIVESSGDAIIATDLEKIITSWNNSASKMLGYKAGEMIGESLLKLVPANQQKLEKKIHELLQTEERIEPIELRFLTNRRQLLDISLTISPVKDSLGNTIGLSQIARNISAQKQNERLLIDREEHLRLAIQAAELGTFDLNLNNGSVNWDSRCRELLGIHRETSEPNLYFLDGVHDDDKDRIGEILSNVLNKSRKDGNYDVEYRTTSVTNKVRWVRVKGRVFFNEEGEPVRFLGAVLDISNQKQEELRKNDFIAIISHELKTPLTSIRSYVQILLAKAKKNGDSFETNALSRAEAQTTKMTSMIKDFLSLNRIEEGKLRIEKISFELHSFFEDIRAEAAFLTSSHNIQINDCAGIQVYADKDKISQVLINLLSNAVKYSSPGSTIQISCKKRNGKVKIFVSDQGIGINAEDQKKLFTRFYRVENEKMKTVSGFGIGLYLVSEIIREHNNEISVKSTEGAGSTFFFSLDTLES